MIKQKKNGNLIIISGTTCAGKGTVLKKLLERNNNLAVSTSYTSREKRENEINGKDYYFVSQKEFEEMIKRNEFLEYEKVHYGCYYGTNKFPETILIFILAPSMEEVKRRIIERGDENNDQIIKRLERAYEEINTIDKYDYVVINDEVDKAVQKIEAILTSEKCKVSNIEKMDFTSKEELLKDLKNN